MPVTVGIGFGRTRYPVVGWFTGSMAIAPGHADVLCRTTMAVYRMAANNTAPTLSGQFLTMKRTTLMTPSPQSHRRPGHWEKGRGPGSDGRSFASTPRDVLVWPTGERTCRAEGSDRAPRCRPQSWDAAARQWPARAWPRPDCEQSGPARPGLSGRFPQTRPQ